MGEFRWCWAVGRYHERIDEFVRSIEEDLRLDPVGSCLQVAAFNEDFSVFLLEFSDACAVLVFDYEESCDGIIVRAVIDCPSVLLHD